MYCIVIPIYKENLDCCEELSLRRLYNIIHDKNYSVYLVCPKGMNIDNYSKIYPNIQIKEFDKKWFKSTATYSQLLINYKFYKAFDKYEYMYIYQLDCYLIEDKLEEWCNKGYDYIGAPIISNDAGWKNYDGKDWVPQVGNGGFSLRKISVFKDITNPNGEFRKYYNLTDEILSKIIFEDKYFCNDIYTTYDLTRPEWYECLYFAIDMNADAIYNIIKFKSLPMCIHAFGKNIRYWKTVIEEMNNKEIIDYCEEQYKVFFEQYYNENNSTSKLEENTSNKEK